MNDAPDDVALLRAWQHGDDAAGNALVRRHFDAVYRFFSGRLRQDGEVTDLAQKTFMSCLERREGWDEIGRFRAYLLGVAHKQLLMHLRHQHVRRGEEACGSLQERLLLSGRSRLSGDVARREQQRVLLAALRRLPLDLQLTLELHYWEGLTTREIGEALGLHGGSIKSRLFTARRLLSENMKQLAGSPEAMELSLRELGHWAASVRRHGGDASDTSDAG